MNADTSTTKSNPKSLVARAGRVLARLLLALGIVYIGIIVYLMLNETRLVYPAKRFPDGNWAPTDLVFEDVWFPADDGVQLNGWILPHPQPRFYILVCHGNAEHAASVSQNWGRRLASELSATVFVFDYRGYGRNGGTPFEANVVADALSARNWFCQKMGIAHQDLVVYGSSLGGGVAVAVAADSPCRALILDRTFDNIVNAGAKRYPWIPVSWLMRNRYDSLTRIARCTMPTFISHFRDDEVIGWDQGRRLFDASPATHKFFYDMPGGHHLQRLPEDYWRALLQFMNEQFPALNVSQQAETVTGERTPQ